MKTYCVYCGSHETYYDVSNDIIRCCDCDAIVDYLFEKE